MEMDEEIRVCPVCGRYNKYERYSFGTAFRNNLTDEEEAALDHMLDMMTAIKQQILLKMAMKEESNVYRLKDNQEELP
jgi:hypothetical protein